LIYRFGSCELDDVRHAFRRQGVAKSLEPQVFDLLHLLLRQPGALVTRDTLIDQVWGGRIVSDSTIAARINAARRAVGDDGRVQRVIRTVSRRGIQLICEVEIGEEAAPPRTAAPADAAQRVRFARSRDDTLIAYATTGRGVPLMRGGHWLTHLEQDWRSPVCRPLLDALGRDFAVTRYDQRGTGLSTRDIARLDLEAMTDDLAAVADAAGLDRFPIYAASQAVPVAVNFAARHPDRVSRLVLYGGYVVGRGLRDDAAERAEGEAFLTMVRSGWGSPHSAFIRAFSTLFMPDASSEQIDSFVQIQLASAGPSLAARLREAIGLFDVSHRLGEVRAPTLVIHPRNDTVHRLDQGLALAAGVPGAELLVLESRNHIPLPQDPAFGELTAAIRDFLTS
jgi:DNA-binding winged helix-turn-helix (wHTH) protein/pimeloyl-ACP methyl ester carboxylesterase